MRVTQRDIAKMTGVSQAVVSAVLNGSKHPTIRVTPETRKRILEAVQSTGYIANPAARGLAKGLNSLIGVYTYESVFPLDRRDFYSPFLVGIEEKASELECDLLLFTSTAADGSRPMFGHNSRIHMADGLVVFGTNVDSADLMRLASEKLPFVSIGRRDDSPGPVPYVGVDYVRVCRELVERAADLGHRHVAYVGSGSTTESMRDRRDGFNEGIASRDLRSVTLDETEPVATLFARARREATAIFTETEGVAAALLVEARRAGVAVPADLSIVALDGHPEIEPPEVDLTRFEIPRREVGAEAVEALERIIQGDAALEQKLLHCRIVDGRTLGPVRNSE